jgi:hypothetical protein
MKVLKLAAVAAVLAMALAQARADQTNLVQTLHVRLTGLKQGGTTTHGSVVITSVEDERIDNRRIIEAIAAVTGNAFSSASRLVLVTPVEGGASAIEVRDGAAKVEVTGFFVFEQVGESVTWSLENTRTGNSLQTIHSIQRFALQNFSAHAPLDLHFDVRGAGLERINTNSRSGSRLGLRVDAAGNGDSLGAPLVLRGSITLSGQTLEVVAGGGGGGVS